MHSLLHVRSSSGLPICLSGLSPFPHLSLSSEIADHDRRREEVKRLKSEHRSAAREIYGSDCDGDGERLAVRCAPCVAKAA